MKKLHSEGYKQAQNFLVELRKRKSVKQSELAEILGVDQSFISKVERGERRLDIVEFIAYCEGLGADPGSTIAAIYNELQEMSNDG